MEHGFPRTSDHTPGFDPEIGDRDPAVGLNQYAFRLKRQMQHPRLVRVIERARYLISHIGGNLHVEPAVTIEQVAERLHSCLCSTTQKSTPC